MNLKPHWIRALMLIEARGPLHRRRGHHGYWGPEDIDLLECAATTSLGALADRGLVLLYQNEVRITDEGRKALRPVPREETA